MTAVDEPGTAALPGLQVLFPDGEEHAKRYLAGSADDTGLRFEGVWEQARDQIVGMLVRPLPPHVDRTTAWAALPDGIRDSLLVEEREFTEAMRRAFPPLAGEVIRDESVSVLSAPFGSAPAGAALYIRTSDLGTMAVVDGLKIVDVANGAIRIIPRPALADIAYPAVQLQRFEAEALAQGGISTVKPVLNLLQMVLFACGPEGVVLAAGIGILELIFGGGEEKPDLPKVINDLVVQDFANDHIKTDLATIVGYAKWLGEQNTKAMSGEMPDKSQKEFADALAELKQYVVNACDPGSQLMTAISNLQNGTYTSDPPYSVLGLPAFLLGASLHLMFEKARLIFATDATTFRSPLAYNIVNVAKDYLLYIDDTIATIDSAFSDRLSKIGELTQGTFYETASGPYGSTSVQRTYVYMVDGAASTWPQQTVRIPSTGGGSYGYPEGIVWYRVCWPKGCAGTAGCDDSDSGPGVSWRSQYVSGLIKQLADKYNADSDRRADYVKVRASLQEIIDKYSKAAPEK